MSTLRLSRHQTLEIVASEPDRIVVETTYLPGGSQPPTHYHPQQDENFEVLAGTLRVELNGEVRDLGPGDKLTVRRGQVHKMWNPGTEAARAHWETIPALRTEEWFRGIDRLQAEAEEQGRSGPAPLAFAAHAAAHRDLFRLVVGGPKPLGDIVVRVLGLVGGLLRR